MQQSISFISNEKYMIFSIEELTRYSDNFKNSLSFAVNVTNFAGTGFFYRVSADLARCALAKGTGTSSYVGQSGPVVNFNGRAGSVG